MHFFSKRALEEYHCDRYQPVGINMARLWTVLKIASPEDILKMECVEGKGVLNIKIIESATDNVKLSTSYITYDCDEEALDFPENINFGSCISMSSTLFYTNLKQLESLGKGACCPFESPAEFANCCVCR